MLETPTPDGLHDFVIDRVVRRYARPDLRAVDLGAGPGAVAYRLHALGCQVLAVDHNAASYKADLPFISLDFDQPDFASQIGTNRFDLVTAIEVIEHVESPIGFLRNVRRLLAPGGVAILTTPNVDSLPARVKFLLEGKVRMMDEMGDQTHVSPILWELFRRQFLPRTGLALREHLVFPPKGYQVTRKPAAWILRIAAAAVPGDAIHGDHHVLVLEAAP